MSNKNERSEKSIKKNKKTCTVDCKNKSGNKIFQKMGASFVKDNSNFWKKYSMFSQWQEK